MKLFSVFKKVFLHLLQDSKKQPDTALSLESAPPEPGPGHRKSGDFFAFPLGEGAGVCEGRPPPLPPPCCNKVSQEEKDQYCILTCIYGIWYQQSYVQGSNGDADVKNRLLDSVGDGEGGMI